MKRSSDVCSWIFSSERCFHRSLAKSASRNPIEFSSARNSDHYNPNLINPFRYEDSRGTGCASQRKFFSHRFFGERVEERREAKSDPRTDLSAGRYATAAFLAAFRCLPPRETGDDTRYALFRVRSVTQRHVTPRFYSTFVRHPTRGFGDPRRESLPALGQLPRRGETFYFRGVERASPKALNPDPRRMFHFRNATDFLASLSRKI